MTTEDPYRRTDPAATGDSTEELPAGGRQPGVGNHLRTRSDFPSPPRSRPEGFSGQPADAPGYGDPRGGTAPASGYGAGYGAAPVAEKRYGPFLPALAAGLVAAALTIVLGQSATSISRTGNQWTSALGTIAAYFDARRYTTQFRLDTGAELAAAVVVGLGTLLLTLIATLGAGRAAARGLLLFAVWGIVTISAAAAAVVGAEVAGSIRTQAFDITSSAMYGALWGVVVGWVPALFAVLLRVGRRRGV